nr:dihydropteroate synthase [Candidatus Cloacimonadota bacterium]
MTINGIFQKAKIMGILNITDDSFSDGGLYLDPNAAIKQAHKLVSEGADILDIGAESTRPGSVSIAPELQWQRLEPVLVSLKEEIPGLCISIDTQSAEVAAKSIELGASIINDISAFRNDPEMVTVLAKHPGVDVVLMHMQGTPKTMQKNPCYQDILQEVHIFFRERVDHALSHGIDANRIILDPGIGFGKNLEHNLKLLANLEYFKNLGCPFLIGASRKSFIDAITPSPENQRIGGSLASTFVACMSGVDIIRVHDVQAHRQFMDVLATIYEVEE